MMLRTEQADNRTDIAARFQQDLDDVSRALGIMQIALEHLKLELQSLHEHSDTSQFPGLAVHAA
jgi:hypothetical protein